MTCNKPGSWAKEEDWSSHRPIFTRLYIDERRTLKDSMDIMEQKYNFFGTVKMYKSHIKRWGLSKNLSASDVPEMLYKRAKLLETGQDPTDLIIRGRRVHPLTIERYLKRGTRSASNGLKGRQKSPLTEHTAASPNVSPDPPCSSTSSPQWLESPVDNRLPDEVIHITQQLVDGCFEGGKRSQRVSNGVFITTEVHEWISNIKSANSLIRSGGSAPGFELLDTCFDQFRFLLLKLEPSLLIYTYYATLLLPRDIGQQLLAYAADVSAITFPVRHPMTLIWAKFKEAGRQQVTTHAWRILSVYFRTLEKRYRHCEADMLHLANILYECMDILNLLEVKTFEESQRNITERLEMMGSTDEMLFSEADFASPFYFDEQYDQASVQRDEGRSA